jgi:hypothetical protein
VRRRSAIFALVAAALLLVGACDRKPSDPAASATADQPAPMADSSAPLPAPEALTDVLYKLADTSVPGASKVSLVEGATADEAVQLDRFSKALADSGYSPLGFAATDLTWSDTVPGNVAARVTVHSANPSFTNGFTFPMEFRPYFGKWQLSRRTADMLLALGNAPQPAQPPQSAQPPQPAQ